MTMLADLVRDFRYAGRSLGLTFVPDEGTGEPVAVVREGFWLRRLGGDPAADGRTITLDGSPHTVVGVVPRDFHFSNGEIDVNDVGTGGARAIPMRALRAEG